MILPGRRVVGGRAEGTVLASERALSFLGGVDAATGEIRDPESPIRGERLAGRILSLPHAKGSTVGSYVLYGLRKRGIAPAAIAASRAETILAVGAVIADVPLVDSVPTELFVTGDRAIVDATHAAIELPDVQERSVVSCFLERQGRVLVVRRSEKVGSFRGKWSGISGFLEGAEDPEVSALREIEEETSLTEVSRIARGSPILSRGGDTVYRIHPFRFHAPLGDVHLDWENVDYRWVDPAELPRLDSVPKLAAAYRATLA